MSALKNLKILDFSTLLPGPFGTLILADLGADVLRIEAPDRYDLLREVGAKDGGATYVHRYLNRSKKSLGLDLKKSQSIDIIKKLIAKYDIVVEQFRPGVMDKLGLGYGMLKAINPELIYCSLTGYGQTGPYRDRAGHDINYLAIAGVSDYSRRKGMAPVPSAVQIADVAGGSMHLVAGLLAAVIQRSETGKGQHVDISMMDAAFTLNALAASSNLGADVETGPEEGMLNGGSFYDYYETSDGRYFSVGGLEPKFIKNMCSALGKPEIMSLALSPDLAQQKEFKQEIAESIKTRSYSECIALFGDKDACMEPVLTLSEACENEQILSRDMIVELEGIKQIGCAIKMSESKANFQFKGCSLGEHNDVLMTELGFSEDEISDLNNAEVFGKLRDTDPNQES